MQAVTHSALFSHRNTFQRLLLFEAVRAQLIHILSSVVTGTPLFVSMLYSVISEKRVLSSVFLSRTHAHILGKSYALLAARTDGSLRPMTPVTLRNTTTMDNY